MDETGIAIKFSDVVQRFGRKSFGGAHRKMFLDHISLNVEQGSITCLLGPSGCGKTTLVNLVIGITIPASGTVTVLGEVAPYLTVRKQVGFMPQDDALYLDITAEENLIFFGNLFGLKGLELTQALDRTFAFAGLENDREKLVSQYSGGMKRRLSLGIAMIHEPSLLVLDEPTVGLDPQHRKRIWSRFREMTEEGTTILVTTHAMDEAARCDKIVMLRNGRLLATGSPDELYSQTNTDNLEDAFLSMANALCEEEIRNA